MRLENSEGYTAERLIRESAEMSLGVTPINVSANTMTTPLFSGKLLVREVQPGLVLTASDIEYRCGDELTVQVESALICGVLLDGEAERMHIGRFGSVEKSLERPVLFGVSESTECTRSPHDSYACKDAGFMVRPTFFERFDDDITDEGLGDLNFFLQQPFASRTLMRAPKVLDIAANLLDHPYNGPLGALFLESSALQFVIEIARMLRTENAYIAEIGRRHYERVMAAREILDHRLINPPSTLDLAREVGSNVTTLQRNFKKVFSTTIFGYVRAQRLRMARVLLAENGLTAAETGQRVGFASASAFAAAYRRHFGHPPSSDRNRNRK